MTQNQETILKLIRMYGGKSVQFYSREAGISVQSVVVVLHALERKGYIKIPRALGRNFYTKLKIL